MLTPSPFRLARVFPGLCFAAAALIFSPNAFAQKGEVNTLIESALERYKRQDYEGARALFVRAHEVDPSEAGILFNLALAELHSGHAVDAANHLRTFIASPAAPPERRESARTKWLLDAEAQVGRIGIEAPPGTAVSIDGAAAGVAPLAQPVYVSPGRHDVVAKLGSNPHPQHLNVEAGHLETAHFVVEQAPPAANGSSYAEFRTTFGVVPSAPIGTSPSTAKIATVAAIGAIAAGAVATGAGLAVDTNAKHRESDANGCGSLPSQPAGTTCGTIAQNGHNEYVWSTALYASGGALAAAALATWFLWPNEPVQTAWTLRPSYDGRTAAAVFARSF